MDFNTKEVKVIDPQQITLQLKALFSSQGLAVVSTNDHGQPYSNLVAFASSEDLRFLVFATTRSTRKFSNIEEDHRVSILIDNRTNHASDFHEAMAVTATGAADEVLGPEKDALLKAYISKHPHLEDFVMSPTCALMRLKVDRYYVVSRFQHVLVLSMKE
ncbi:MAG TPA: pyridoxamine 5'-phosphate oxidase family protein [Desulfomonilia bacterium]|nr:pyridoxamine 5'-phosphate oxidase family protein [Desulfomonilia bacterium]